MKPVTIELVSVKTSEVPFQLQILQSNLSGPPPNPLQYRVRKVGRG